MANDPQLLSRTTLAYYEETAASFWHGTRDHDVSQNIAALLDAIAGAAPFRILDLGCGPGRDLKAFCDLGHEATGLDGAAPFVEMARQYSGCPVLHQDFLALDLPQGDFDGVFANAVLFHVPRQELARVLGELHDALVPGGVLFCSNPRGDNEEAMSGGRYGCYHDYAAWNGFVTGAGFTEIRHYYRPPDLPRHRQPWLATVWGKT